MVKLRNGHEPQEPWTVGNTKSGQTNWIWPSDSEYDFDIVAVRSVDAPKRKDGRQANGSFE